jgi:hypothetical protein
MALTAKQKREDRLQQQAAEAGQSPVEAINEAAIRNPGSVSDAHGEIARPSSGGSKVVVGCKLGIAYIDLQLCRIEDKFEQNMQGGRTVKEAVRIGSVVRIRGTAYPRGTPPKGFPSAPEIVGGAALNRGVDAEWWREWEKQNHLNPLVLNKMIFAHESEDAVRGAAREMSGILSGLDPINPESDNRITRSSRSEVTNVEPGTR